jgi:hypothetical protein
MQLIHVTPLLTTTERPSFATRKAIYRIPLSLHFAASDCLIGRDAFDRSVSPRQKRSNPPPVPEMPTVISAPEFRRSNLSAAAVTYGPTVLEPSAEILPETPVRLVEAVAAAASASARTATVAARTEVP